MNAADPYRYHYNSPLGGITLSSNGHALTELRFNDQKGFSGAIPESVAQTALPVFSQACQWLDIYFSGREPAFTPPLCPKGTPFRENVWQILLTIPYGKTVTYGQIAGSIAGPHCRRMSAQAIGGAVGSNPIALMIPCHRVIGANGSLTGYAGGLDRKAKLLALEASGLLL